jgi:outer membrane receptor for ferrienterochelin and colicin
MNTHLVRGIGLLALAGATGQGLAAQTPELFDLSVEQLLRMKISVATGSAQSLRQTPAVATLISAADIAAMGANDLDEVLETVAGMHVNRQSIAYVGAYLMRGIGAYSGSNGPAPQVLLLLDGVPVTDLFTGERGAFWGGMPLTNVARIEVLRGPGSALYGADAFAGVINVITYSPSDLRGTTLALRRASFNSSDGSILHGATYGPVAVGAYLRLGHTDGARDVIEADAQTLNDRRFGTRVSLAPGPVSLSNRALDGQLELVWDNWRWRASVKLRDDLGVGVGVTSALDPSHTFTSRRLLSELAWNSADAGADWTLGAAMSVMQLHEDTPDGIVLFPPGAKLGPNFFPDGMIGGPARWQRSTRLSAFARYTGWNDHTVRVGLGHDDLDLYRATTFKNFLLGPTGAPIPTGPVIDYGLIQPHILPYRRRDDYLYLQDEWQLSDAWMLTAGVRHDHYSDFGGTTNPRLALVWDASAELTFKLLRNHAFRAPSFNEVAGVNPNTNGNPDLRPERIVTHEAVLAWQGARGLAASLNVFHYDMKDIIAIRPNPAPAPGGTLRNAGNVVGRGAELELAWNVHPRLRLMANYAYQSSTDTVSGQDPGYAPHQHAYARADWQFGADVTLSPQVTRVADRRRAVGDARAPIADYTTLDLTLRGAHRRWRWSVAARNLFNTDAREPSQAPGLTLPGDLPLPGRSLALQLSHTL